MTRTVIAGAIQAAGLAVLVVGIALLSIPAALIVAGLGIGAFGVAYERG
jgi:hypothetical protein